MKSNKNFNGTKTGIAGAGMSYSCKLQMLNSLDNNSNAIVIDPEGEISKLTNEIVMCEVRGEEALKCLETMTTKTVNAKFSKH